LSNATLNSLPGWSYTTRDCKGC